jgi:DNA modification methylase
MNPEQRKFEFKADEEGGPVECLGMTFENDAARREYFTDILRKKLKDPEFRKTEGFPIGEDKDILALSDPPYYTACPNPFLGDFVKYYGKPYNPKDKYHREPFAADVSEGKNHPIFSGHSFHTKVPHKAIMRFILHYTEPGDVVFDGFCGTGMTAVAAQQCGDSKSIYELGYQTKDSGIVINGNVKELTKAGVRKTILNDLSPIATFIASQYNIKDIKNSSYHELENILKEIKKEWSWLYLTKHENTDKSGIINYVVWSDVFICPSCNDDVVFYDAAYSSVSGKLKENLFCPHCNSAIDKRHMAHSIETYYDSILKKTNKRNKQLPVQINYSYKNHRYFKRPDSNDLKLIADIENKLSNESILSQPMMFKGGENWGAIWRAGYHYGITHAHHFYSPRNLFLINRIWMLTKTNFSKWLITGVLNYLNKKQSFTGGGGGMPGVLYIASLVQEKNVFDVLERKIKKVKNVFSPEYRMNGQICLGTQSSTRLDQIPNNSIDYIFIDPPFGGNIMYSEGSFLWESWLKVFTNNRNEAITSRFQNKGVHEYSEIMLSCFREFHRILKPGRWMTVEFSNTQASIWNVIQATLQEAGFVVANVAGLDKKQGGFKAVTTSTAVKQDLVISVYKPNGGLEKRFPRIAETEDGVWDFVRTHLNNLPVLKARGGQLEIITERDPRILYDRTVAYYVRHGFPVPLSSPQFQAGLADKFPERDGMYFLPEQAAEYDKKRVQMEGLGQLKIWVEDERSAADWLRSYLKDKPSKTQDVQPEFFEQLNQSWKKWEIKPELRSLLNQYFLCYDSKGDVPPQIHAYLSTNFKDLRKLPADDPSLRAKAKDRWYVPDHRKNADVEKLRDKRLLEEFWTYLPPGYQAEAAKKGSSDQQQKLPGMEKPQPKTPRGKRLKLIRTEAVRVGFRHCYQNKDYPTIIAVAHHIPDDVVNGDDQLQMIYDTAMTRSGNDF